MSQKYYTILTKLGAELLANATALGVPLKLTQIAVGDANGSIPNPVATQTSLVHEVRRAAINTLFVDKDNPNQLIAEQVIPETEGGWFIHEIGLYDDKGNLIAVGNCPATYKPKLVEGSARTQVIRMVIIIDDVNAVELKIDPAVVLATRKYVDELIATKMANHEKSTNHPDATTKSKGFVQLNSATDSTAEDQAATPLAVKDTFDYAKYVDEKAQSSYNHATDAHNRITDVHNIVNNMIDKFRPTEFESEMYSGDKRFVFVVRNDGLAGVYDTMINEFSWFFTQNGWISGYIEASRIGGLEQFVRDRMLPSGIPQPWPSDYIPNGWFLCNGAPFDVNQFPRLASVYPWGTVPDLRGLFIRGKDFGRGLDPNREILSFQDDAIRNIWGDVWPISETFGQNGGTGTGAFSTFNKIAAGTPTSTDYGDAGGFRFDASRIVPVADENRPRNIAFNYIVKAE